MIAKRKLSFLLKWKYFLRGTWGNSRIWLVNLFLVVRRSKEKSSCSDALRWVERHGWILKPGKNPDLSQHRDRWGWEGRTKAESWYRISIIENGRPSLVVQWLTLDNAGLPGWIPGLGGPHATGKLSTQVTATEPMCLEPMFHKERNHWNEKPTHGNYRINPTPHN